MNTSKLYNYNSRTYQESAFRGAIKDLNKKQRSLRRRMSIITIFNGSFLGYKQVQLRCQKII